MTEDSCYRDELAAAHARIADLEAKLADRRSGGPSYDDWVKELEAKKRDAIAKGNIGTGSAPGRARVIRNIGIVAAILGVPWSLIVGHVWPLFIVLLVFAYVSLLVFGTGKAKARLARAEAQKIDEKIADLRRMFLTLDASARRARIETSYELGTDETASEPMRSRSR